MFVFTASANAVAPASPMSFTDMHQQYVQAGVKHHGRRKHGSDFAGWGWQLEVSLASELKGKSLDFAVSVMVRAWVRLGSRSRSGVAFELGSG